MKISKMSAALLSGMIAFSCTGGTAFAEVEPSIISVTSGLFTFSKLPAPKDLKVIDIAETSVTLKWNKVKGAKSYKVYIYNTEKKKYTVYTTVEDTSCKVEKLKSNKTYSFAVAAVTEKGGKTVSGERSKDVKAKTAKKKPVKKFVLKKYALKEPTVKIVACKEVFPKDGATAKLFKDIYGGNIRWYPTVWDFRYADLATFVYGGEGIDLCPYDAELFKKGMESRCFEPIDSYVDLKSDMWQSVSTGVEAGKANEKHYLLATDAPSKKDISGFMLVKGTANPEGAARLAECELYITASGSSKTSMSTGKKQSGVFTEIYERLTDDLAIDELRQSR